MLIEPPYFGTSAAGRVVDCGCVVVGPGAVVVGDEVVGIAPEVVVADGLEQAASNRTETTRAESTRRTTWILISFLLQAAGIADDDGPTKRTAGQRTSRPIVFAPRGSPQ